MSPREKKPVLLSGMQPTGNLMIGNYLGALRNWVELQAGYDCLFALMDLHALTTGTDPPELLRRSYEFIALYLACGIDPGRSTVFVQSQVPGHAHLAWILNCFAYMGELNRMTQFKDKARRQPENLNFHESKPGISNLMVIYSALAGKSLAALERNLLHE